MGFRQAGPTAGRVYHLAAGGCQTDGREPGCHRGVGEADAVRGPETANRRVWAGRTSVDPTMAARIAHDPAVRTVCFGPTRGDPAEALSGVWDRTATWVDRHRVDPVEAGRVHLDLVPIDPV